MATTVVTSIERKNPSGVERMGRIKTNNPQKEKVPKIDHQAIVDAWSVTTDIIDRIKKNNPDNPFYVTITPDMAMDILTLNDSNQNRNVDWGIVDIDVSQMKSGDWKQKNGDTICISKSLKLLDGQHRLWSIFFSGVPCVMIIVTGLDEDVFSYKDIGRKRNANDVTQINGYGANSGQLSQAVKLILLYKKRLIVKGSISERDVPNHEVNKFEQEKGRMSRILKDLNEVIKIDWAKNTNDWLTPAQWAFVFYTLRTLPGMDNKAKEFLDSFVHGVNLNAKSPVKIVRGYFENDFKHLSRGNGRNKRTNKATLTTKIKYLFAAWNHYVLRDTLSEIKVDLNDPLILKPVSKAI